MDDQQEFRAENIQPEHRKFKRVSKNYIISYAPVKGEDLKFDVSQTKNLSEGGILFMSDRQFEKDTVLKIKLRLPEFLDYVIIRAQVIESKKLAKGIIYETRARFTEVEQVVREAIRKLVDYG